jgi:hypothetical protein
MELDRGLVFHEISQNIFCWRYRNCTGIFRFFILLVTYIVFPERVFLITYCNLKKNLKHHLLIQRDI